MEASAADAYADASSGSGAAYSLGAPLDSTFAMVQDTLNAQLQQS